jgi:ankyrin repeat protein
MTSDDELVTYSTLGSVADMMAQVESGTNLDPQTHEGCTALHYAAWHGHTSDVTALVEAGTHLDTQSNEGCTALMYAARNWHTSTVTALIAAGADLDVQDLNDWTALMYAAEYAYLSAAHYSAKSSTFLPETVIALIDAGADLDVQDLSGWTALTIAALNGYNAVFTALVKAGAAMYAGRDEWTALKLATRYSHFECMAVLHSAEMHKHNVLARAARFTVLSGEAEDNSTNLRLYESLLERVLLAVESRTVLADLRGVCKAWRRVADCTLMSRPVEFFAPRNECD